MYFQCIFFLLCHHSHTTAQKHSEEISLNSVWMIYIIITLKIFYRDSFGLLNDPWFSFMLFSVFVCGRCTVFTSTVVHFVSVHATEVWTTLPPFGHQKKDKMLKPMYNHLDSLTSACNINSYVYISRMYVLLTVMQLELLMHTGCKVMKLTVKTE